MCVGQVPSSELLYSGVSHQNTTSCYYSQPAPNVYNTVSGVAPREAPFRSIDLGEVALRSLPT